MMRLQDSPSSAVALFVFCSIAAYLSFALVTQQRFFDIVPWTDDYGGGFAKEARGCTDQNKIIRRDWANLSDQDREQFLTAVQCLTNKPSIIPNSIAESQSYYDDFTAVHINASYHTHETGFFMTWHRNFIFLFERALREDCGLTIGLPYWNWPTHIEDAAASPIFGSTNATFGEAVGSADHDVKARANNGGHCVTTGPFANLTVPFIVSDANFPEANESLPINSFKYQPHCLRRNLSQAIYSANFQPAQIDHLIYETPDIDAYFDVMTGFTSRSTTPPGDQQDVGPHIAGHVAVGGELYNFFASTQDPLFYLHHSMIDRTYAMWQALDPATRMTALTWTATYRNTPPSPNVTLDTVQDLFWHIGRPMRTGDLMSISEGPFCYEYE